eukprot:scaffold70598_cov30-Tisochrysis_lutea.AAC.3
MTWTWARCDELQSLRHAHGVHIRKFLDAPPPARRVAVRSYGTFVGMCTPYAGNISLGPGPQASGLRGPHAPPNIRQIAYIRELSIIYFGRSAQISKKISGISWPGPRRCS